MRLTDQFGYDITLEDKEALAAWTSAVNAFLAHGATTAGHLQDALERDPEFALGHAARGLFCLLLARRELYDTAEEAWKTAAHAARTRPVTPREAVVTAALRAWLDGWPSHSADLLDEALVKAPRDALLLKLSHAIRFILGDSAGLRTSIERIMPAYDEKHPSYGYVLGCRSFALEETGSYREAEAVGRRGLEFCSDDAWGLHAVAHVHDMTGRSEEGIGWLESRPDGWAHCNNFGYHVWWHLALMYLDRGEIGKVLDLYDRKIRQDHTDDFRDISNGTSLLMRLEMEGVNVGGRWEELAALSDKRAEDGCNVFADLHYLMALLSGGRRMGTERLITDLRRRTKEEGDLQRISAEAGLPAAMGLEQYRKGNYASAFTMLSSAREAMPTIGGSHAQRDVFERMTIDAAIRAGLAEDAEKLLKDRTSKRGGLDRFAEQRLEVCDRMQRASLVMQNERLRATPA